MKLLIILILLTYSSTLFGAWNFDQTLKYPSQFEERDKRKKEIRDKMRYDSVNMEKIYKIWEQAIAETSNHWNYQDKYTIEYYLHPLLLTKPPLAP